MGDQLRLMAEEADHVFVYGKLRPDAPDNTEPLGNASNAKKAYLMGGRLYCLNKGGQEKAALRLEEAGHAVTGYVVKAADSGAMPALLQEFESKEYSPQLYERDVVEVRQAFSFNISLPFFLSSAFDNYVLWSILLYIIGEERETFDDIDLCLLNFSIIRSRR